MASPSDPGDLTKSIKKEKANSLSLFCFWDFTLLLPKPPVAGQRASLAEEGDSPWRATAVLSHFLEKKRIVIKTHRVVQSIPMMIHSAERSQCSRKTAVSDSVARTPHMQIKLTAKG